MSGARRAGNRRPGEGYFQFKGINANMPTHSQFTDSMNATNWDVEGVLQNSAQHFWLCWHEREST